jgi:hypothetical protein
MRRDVRRGILREVRGEKIKREKRDDMKVRFTSPLK